MSGLEHVGAVRIVGSGRSGMRMSTLGVLRVGRGGEMSKVVGGGVRDLVGECVCVVEWVSSGSTSGSMDPSGANLLVVGVAVAVLVCALQVTEGFTNAVEVEAAAVSWEEEEVGAREGWWFVSVVLCGSCLCVCVKR